MGAFNWSGGALLYNTQNSRGRFLNQTAKEDPGAAQYSYLGKGRVWWMQGGRTRVGPGGGQEKQDSRRVGRRRGPDGESGAWRAMEPSKRGYVREGLKARKEGEQGLGQRLEATQGPCSLRHRCCLLVCVLGFLMETSSGQSLGSHTLRLSDPDIENYGWRQVALGSE